MPSDKLTSQIYATFKNGQYKYLAEYALAGSAFFIDKSCEKDMFAKLRAKLKAEYKPYTDKGKITAKQRNLQECVTAVMKDLRQTARTREQCINTAKLLYQLADRAALQYGRRCHQAPRHTSYFRAWSLAAFQRNFQYP